jgi:hypothetical protein
MEVAAVVAAVPEITPLIPPDLRAVPAAIMEAAEAMAVLPVPHVAMAALAYRD